MHTKILSLRATILPAIVLGLFLLLTHTASAADRFGVIGVTNNTDIAIRYRVKISDKGEWESYIIQPGARRTFSHRYEVANEDRSPYLYLRFDSDLRRTASGKSEDFMIEHKLKRRAAIGSSYEEGKKYAFVYDHGNRQFIELVSID